jgi:hypothetical protein
MKYLVVVAVLIITGLLSKHTAPQHINKQATPTHEQEVQVASVKQELPEKVAVTQPQVVQEQTVTPIVTSTVPDCNAYDALIIENFGADQLTTAKAVMRAESSCRSDAVGDNHITYVQDGITYGMSCGLFQIRILPGRDTCEAYKNPEHAIRKAGLMFKGQGWRPWSAFTSGKYKQFL